MTARSRNDYVSEPVSQQDRSRLLPFVSPTFLEQVAAPQPALPLPILAWMLPALLQNLIFRAVLGLPPIDRAVAEHHIAYITVFFTVQCGLIISSSCLLAIRFRSALFPTKSSCPRRGWVAWIPGFPVLAWNVWVCAAVVWSLFHSYSSEQLDIYTLHSYFWSSQEYGASALGVALSSVAKLVGAFIEEIAFTGFLVNAFARWIGIKSALLLVPVLFTAAHIPKYGLNWSLCDVFLAGLSCAAVRVYTGSLAGSIRVHILINTLALVPRWIEAGIYFAAHP